MKEISYENREEERQGNRMAVPPDAYQGDSHRRRGSGSVKRGRIKIGIIFLILIVLYVGMLIHILPEVKRYQHQYQSFLYQRLEAALIVRMIWMSVLFPAIWLRRKWARYVLVASETLTAFGFIAGMIELLDARLENLDQFAFGFTVLAGLTHMACVWLLVTSHDVRRLANRTYRV